RDRICIADQVLCELPDIFAEIGKRILLAADQQYRYAGLISPQYMVAVCQPDAFDNFRESIESHVLSAVFIIIIALYDFHVTAQPAVFKRFRKMAVVAEKGDICQKFAFHLRPYALGCIHDLRQRTVHKAIFVTYADDDTRIIFMRRKQPSRYY